MGSEAAKLAGDYYANHSTNSLRSIEARITRLRDLERELATN